MPFGPVDPDLDLLALEERVLARWREREVIAEAARLRKGGEPWIFYEGPPTANGRPGLHHVWARVFKDLYPRFQTMRGRDVPRKGGWDCHGLPVELEVEKELGLPTKHEIEAYGIAEFNPRCRDVGAALRRGLVVADRAAAACGSTPRTPTGRWTTTTSSRSGGWCASCGTRACSTRATGSRPTAPAAAPPCRSHEVAPGLPGRRRPVGLRALPARGRRRARRRPARVDDDAVDADLQRRPPPSAPTSPTCGSPAPTAAATWSWPSAAREPPVPRGAGRSSAGPAPTWPPRAGATSARSTSSSPSTARTPGGWWPPTSSPPTTARASSTSPPPSARTTPQVGRAEDLPVLNPVDADGAFDHRVPPWTGRFVKDADRRDHRRPRAPGACSWPRSPTSTATPTAGAAARRSSTGPRRRGSSAPPSGGPTCSRENEAIGWHPEHIKHGRFGKWLEGNVDWALSRDRYWGTPLPIWRCGDAATTRASARWPSWPSWPGATWPTSTCTGPTSTT